MYIENKFSQNALNCINAFEVPVYMFSSRLTPFIREYENRYPFNAARINLLRQTTPEDWAFASSRFKATSFHHVGSDYQYLGFYDMWALCEEILKICKTNNGYQIKILADLRRQKKKEYSRIKEEDPRAFFTTVVSQAFNKMTGESYIIKAPAIKYKDVLYVFNYQISQNGRTRYFTCDEPFKLPKGDYYDGGTGIAYKTKYNGRHNWNNIHNANHIWKQYPDDSIRKLDSLVKKNRWRYGDGSFTDNRPKLERKVS